MLSIMLGGRLLLGVGVGDGRGVGVGVGDGVGVGVGDGVGLGEGDGVGEGLGVGEGDGLAVGEGLGDGDGVGVAEGLGVGVGLTGVPAGRVPLGTLMRSGRVGSSSVTVHPHAENRANPAIQWDILMHPL